MCMRRCLRHILLLLLLAVFTSSIAQEEEYLSDSVATLAPPLQMQQENSGFMPVTALSPVAVRKVSPAKLTELKNDDAYWYANLEPRKKEKEKKQQQPSSNKSWLEAGWFHNLLWIIILCSFIGVVIFYLASSDISFFQKKTKRIQDEEAAEEIPDDIFSIQYEREIKKAVDNKNYRLAIRLWYLLTLKELAHRNIIDYRHEKTDSDYVNSLYGSSYYHNFFRLTRNFEYTW